jgi:hypothetical protein
MTDLFSRKWIIATVIAWLFIILLDELSWAAWRQFMPNSQWKGLIVKHPITPYPTDQGGGIPNGYRPAGGQ